MDAPLPAGLAEEVERLVVADAGLPPGLDLYDAVFDSGLLFPLQRRRESARMMALARLTSPRVVMEIGADKGGGCYQWLKGLEPEKFIGIEIRGIPYAGAFASAFPDTRQLWLAASSYAPGTVGFVAAFLEGEKIDVLFIDGDKAEFYTDFESYLPLVRPGGLVLMHDVQDPAPGEAFRRARQHPRVTASEAIIDTSEALEALGREVRGLPPANPHEGWLRHWRGRSCGVGALRC